MDVNNTLDTVKFAKLVKQTYGRTSLTRSAKDTVAQFPVIFSADIPTEDAVIIAKALEAQYAALLVAVISAHSDYDRAKFDNPSDYLRSFHNNHSIPSLFLSLDSQLPDGESSLDCSLESAVTMYDLEKLVSRDVVMECWTDSMDQYTERSLNSMYRPETATQNAMESIVANLRAIHRPAMEADTDRINGLVGVAGNRTTKDMLGAPTKADRVQSTTKPVVRKDADGKEVRDKHGNPVMDMVTTKDKVLRSPAATGRQEIVRNDRLTALEPTLINLQLNSHHGDSPIITHNVVMGVKAMIRTIPQQFMISNLADGATNSHGIFKFIRWTEGNYHLIWDMLLGVDDAKTSAVSNRDMRTWLSALKRRKTSSRINATFTGQQMPPMTTVVCTSYEIAKIAEVCGVDLSEPYNAVKLMSKYYLLGFIIYDPDTGTVRSIFDGDTNYSVTSLGGLKTKQQKDQDLTQFSNFLRAAGRM